jgi:probable F420-dependent oxidoreductase
MHMQVVASLSPETPLGGVGEFAVRIESIGYDALHVPETVHDPFVCAALALEATTTLTVRTSVALAFPRSPMVVAYAAWDLARYSGGRFELGLGTQVRANIEGRYGVPWRDPVGRMREYVGALRAIFDAFQTGAPLRFLGDHYRLTRLQPYFNPGPLDVRAPTVWLGGVNAKICRLAGEIADGFVTHPTNSDPRYLEAICVPNVRASGRDVALVVGGPVVTGRAPDDVARERERQRRTLGFLYSTPAYRRTLELRGWSSLGERLHALSRNGRWDEMTSLIGDEVLDALVVQGTWDELPSVLDARYGRVASGVLVPPPADASDDADFAAVVRAVAAT